MPGGWEPARTNQSFSLCTELVWHQKSQSAFSRGSRESSRGDLQAPGLVLWFNQEILILVFQVLHEGPMNEPPGQRWGILVECQGLDPYKGTPAL